MGSTCSGRAGEDPFGKRAVGAGGSGITGKSGRGRGKMYDRVPRSQHLGEVIFEQLDLTHPIGGDPIERDEFGHHITGEKPVGNMSSDRSTCSRNHYAHQTIDPVAARRTAQASTMHVVSDSGPFDDDLPDDFNLGDLFGNMGDPNAMMANFLQMFSGMSGSPGDGGLDNAMQIAVSIAAGGESERNVDPVDRIALEQLARVAELQIGKATGLRTATGSPLTIAPVNKGEWVRRSLNAHKPLLEQLAAAMATPALDDDLAGDPEIAMFEQFLSSMRPMMVNLTTGSMIGHLGSRALGTYDLPIPRPGSNELLVVVPNLDEFGEEWSLDREELHLWIALSEVAHHAVLSIPHVAQHLSLILGRYANAFRNDPSALTESLESFEPSGDFAEVQARIQEMFGDPSALLGSMRSPEQEAILPEIAAVTGAIVGYIDHIMDSIGTGLISSYGQLTEALRRRRVTTSSSDRFVERLLGLELDQGLYDRGRAFIDGIVDREGEPGLAKLWEKAEHLPTPNELDAPGLWLARIELTDDDSSDS